MKKFTGKHFDNVRFWDKPQTFSDMAFSNCTFDNCNPSIVKAFKNRATIRNITIENCRVVSSTLGPAIAEDIVIDGLRVDDLLIVWCPLLRHVSLRGKIGPVKINKVAHFQDRNRKVVQAADPKQPQHYAGVDWALDISQAQCVDLSIEGIPANKIIRDPETQVVVTRQLTNKRGWRKKVSEWNSYWPYVIDYHLEDEEDDMVLVAPKGNKKAKFKKLLDGIKELCDLGVAVREYP